LTGIEEAAGDITIELKFAAAAVTLSVALLWRVPDLAVMVTVPEAEPVAIPDASMLAMFESEEIHCTELVTSLVVLLDITAVAVNC
jgi:hypothetical protein